LVRFPGKGPCVEFDSSGVRLGFTAEGNTLNLLEVAGEPARRTLVSDAKVEWNSATFSPDGRVLAVTASDGVVLWDIARRNTATTSVCNGVVPSSSQTMDVTS
jgi:hypothetical protein